MRVQLTADPDAFLHEARTLLAADPVRSSVVATQATRYAAHLAAGGALEDFWYALVESDGGEVVGVAMRTMPNPPHAMFVMAMPDEAAAALGEHLVAEGIDSTAVNGALPAAEIVLASFGEPTVEARTRLFEARRVVWPEPCAGEARLATPADAELCRAWFDRFHIESEEQGGRTPQHLTPTSTDEMLSRIVAKRLWLWQVGGEVVHLTGFNHPVMGVARIGPVYTPAEHRGRG